MEIISQPVQEFTVLLKMNENEARALNDIVAYGYEPFMEVFKKHLGSHYIKQHEKGCKTLFEAVRDQMPRHFKRFDEARKIFNESKYQLSKINQ